MVVGLERIKKIAIASDHRGVALKKELSEFLRAGGFEVTDLGTHSEEPCDYPDVAFPLAQSVSSSQFDRGILVCMSGTGMAICANKVKGIRAAICDSVEQAVLSRKHNDANVLILGSQFVQAASAKAICQAWLTSEFEGGRHERRVRKIIDFEKGQ